MWRDTAADTARSRPLRRHLRPHGLLAVAAISCWAVSLGFDIASLSATEPASMARAATSMIGYGVHVAAVAAIAGFVDALSVPPGTKAFRLALIHFGLMTTASIGYLVGYVVRRSEPLGQPVGAQSLTVSLIGAALVAVGAVAGALLAHRRV
ncbi:DUF2231 domain-containing protein [Actinosynnema sp. CA-248983]